VAVFAEGVGKGQNEIAGRLSYANVDAGPVETTETDFSLSYGRYLTDSHQVGLIASYFDQEIEEEGFGSVSADGTALGAFYHFNFLTSGIITPFLGVNASFLGGDIGDVYDFQYGIEGGIKVYPFEHAGFAFGIEWSQLQASEDYYEDADGLAFGAGLLIRF
jgi:hypothetical protein